MALSALMLLVLAALVPMGLSVLPRHAEAAACPTPAHSGGFVPHPAAAPRAWQPAPSGAWQPLPVGSTVRSNGARRSAFAGGVDRARPLLALQPTGAYATYLGGGTFDQATGIAVDGAGNVYVVGFTDGAFPVQNAAQGSYGGNTDAFVAKLNPSGQIVYATYLGGGGTDQASGVAVDGAGNVYVVGLTEGGFPVANAAQATYGGGSMDAFVAKLNPSGQVVYATYLGGGGTDQANGVAVDGAGNVYVAGLTVGNFPVQNAAQETYGGIGDAFVTKLDASGQVAYATYLGGGGFDQAASIAVDGAGNAYVAGFTLGSFPVQNAAQAGYGGDTDAFVAKLDARGQIAYTTYLGGGGFDHATGVAVDGAGNAYVAGFTSGEFPVHNGGQEAFAEGAFDGFVAKLNPGGQMVYATYLGGGGYDQATAIAVDGAGNAYVAGLSDGYFPVQRVSLDPFEGGSLDAFAARLSASGQLVYATYLGGSDFDRASGIAVDRDGNAYVTGFSAGGFPVANAAQAAFGGGSVDAFVVKLSLGDPAGR